MGGRVRQPCERPMQSLRLSETHRYALPSAGAAGSGHKARFCEPYRTRFILATVYGDMPIDRGYVRKVVENVGWKRRAYLLVAPVWLEDER